MRADIAKTLDGDASAARLAAKPAQQLERLDADATASCFLAAGNAVILDRLACHGTRIETVVLVVLVHDPGHDAVIGAHVWRGDVVVRPDHIVNFVNEFARDAFQLADAELGHVDCDATLRAAERYVHDCRFPRHQRRQAANFVQVYFRVVTQAALHRSTSPIVLHAVTDQRAQLRRYPFRREFEPAIRAAE